LTNVNLTLRRTFPLYERFKLEISAMETNLPNHPEWNAQPSAGAGATDTVNNPANGQIPGYGSGTYGMGTFDPRQIQFQGRITF
jgi:trimeric autotransporter adhesin